jgi:hypothetical protein
LEKRREEKRREMVSQQLHVASNDHTPFSLFTQWEPIVKKQQKPLRLLGFSCVLFALPTKGKHIVFRFIIEYSSLKDFSP